MLNYKIIRKIIHIVFNPIFLTELRLRKALEKIVSPLVFDGITCLDVGCGDRPYEYLFKKGTYIGIDVEDSGRPLTNKYPDYFYDGSKLPFAENKFDIVISTQVLKHVPNSISFLKEMIRDCKPGGRIIISAPFVWQEHEEPFDYFRFPSFGVGFLLKDLGLTLDVIKKDTSSIETIAMLINCYIIHNLMPKIKGIGRLYSPFIFFPIQIIAIALTKILPDKGQIYLNLVVSARKSNNV